MEPQVGNGDQSQRKASDSHADQYRRIRLERILCKQLQIRCHSSAGSLSLWLLRALKIRFDLAYLSFPCFIFIYTPHWPASTHCTDTHIASSLQFPPRSLQSQSFLSLLSLNLSLTLPSLLSPNYPTLMSTLLCHSSLSIFSVFTCLSSSMSCSPSTNMIFRGQKLGFIGLHIPRIWHTYLPRKDMKVEKEDGGREG